MQLWIQPLWHIWKPKSSYLAGFAQTCRIKAIGKWGWAAAPPGWGREAGQHSKQGRARAGQPSTPGKPGNGSKGQTTVHKPVPMEQVPDQTGSSWSSGPVVQPGQGTAVSTRQVHNSTAGSNSGLAMSARLESCSVVTQAKLCLSHIPV